MIIHNFNTAGMAVCPDKANPPLVIDADAVLTLPVAFRRFQTIAGRYFQKTQIRSGIQLLQFAHRHRFNIGKPFHPPALKQGFGVFAVEFGNHRQIITKPVNNVKRY